jgi:hypothetical protein
LKSEKELLFSVPRKETIVAKLTDHLIRKELQVEEGEKDVLAFDDKLPGFGVRKFASGKVSYFVKYSFGEQQRRKTLGSSSPGRSTPSEKR